MSNPPSYGTDQPPAPPMTSYLFPTVTLSSTNSSSPGDTPEFVSNSAPDSTPLVPPPPMANDRTTSQKSTPKFRPRARTWSHVRAFLETTFHDAEVVEYIYTTARPDTVADLQLAETETNLQAWLPALSGCQVRKLWRALSHAPDESTPLLLHDSDRDSETDFSGDPHLPPPRPPTVVSAFSPAVTFAAAPRELPRLGSFSRIWPGSREKGSFMVENSHFFPPSLLWIDVSGEPMGQRNPSWQDDYAEYLEELAAVYHIHPASIKDILTPGELPKTEFTAGVTFCLMRYCVEQPMDADVDDISDVSSKLVVIITTHPTSLEVDVVIALHLHPLRTGGDSSEAFEGYYEMQSEEYLQKNPEMTKDHLVNILFDDVLDTYEIALDRLHVLVDDYERRLTQWTETDVTTELYSVRRRVSVYKRLLQMTQQSIQKYVRHVYRCAGHDPFAEDLRDTVRSLMFTADDLYECTTEMLNLHISLVSHRSNHLLYVLTTLTVIFTPLTFIGSVYGMNFENMPELHFQYGYYVCLLGMLCTVCLTLGCLKYNGFICVRPPEAQKVHV